MEKETNYPWLFCWTYLDPTTTGALWKWGEAMSLILALPSNSCKEFLGQKIGDRVVDKWGAEVSCATVPRGSFIRRQDRIKSCISLLATYCGIDFICEPQSIFTAHIPQRPLNWVKAHQVRQGLRPDFVFKVPAPSGQTSR